MTITDKIFFFHFTVWPSFMHIIYLLLRLPLLLLSYLARYTPVPSLTTALVLFFLFAVWMSASIIGYKTSRTYILIFSFLFLFPLLSFLSSLFLFLILFSLTFFPLAEKHIQFFGPVKAMKWWTEVILAGEVWRSYKILLAAPTAWCYTHRNTFFIGEVSHLLSSFLPFFLSFIVFDFLFIFFIF